MTPRGVSQSVTQICGLLSALLLAALPAYPQATLTGAMWFASSPSGGTSVNQGYADGALNTMGGDQWWDLWLALRPDATLPVNGPADEQAGIAIPLEAGKSYKYYMFGQGPCCALAFSGLNLFFDGDSSSPGISVFGAVNSPVFQPNSNSSTFTLSAGIVRGSGNAFYSSAGVIVVLTGYEWQGSNTSVGDVCQEFAFTPASGDVQSDFGSFSLHVYPEAGVTLGQSSGSPDSKIAITGSGFAPSETVEMYSGGSFSLLGTVTANSAGAFSASVVEPQQPYGSLNFFAYGNASGKLGAATLSVTPSLKMLPESVAPGGSTTAYGVGFGAGELVSIYLDAPRQLLATATANGVGSFAGGSAVTVTIPANAQVGLNGLIGIGQTTSAIGIGKITVK